MSGMAFGHPEGVKLGRELGAPHMLQAGHHPFTLLTVAEMLLPPHVPECFLGGGVPHTRPNRGTGVELNALAPLLHQQSAILLVQVSTAPPSNQPAPPVAPCTQRWQRWPCAALASPKRGWEGVLLVPASMLAQGQHGGA